MSSAKSQDHLSTDVLIGPFLSKVLSPFVFSSNPTAVLCLVHQLSKHLKRAEHYDLSWSFVEFDADPGIEDVLSELDRCEQRIRDLGFNLPTIASSNVDANIIQKIGLDANPVSAYLFQSRKHTGLTLGTGLRLLFLSRCWSSLNHDPNKAGKFAGELRKAELETIRENSRAAFLLRVGKIDPKSFSTQLNAFLKTESESSSWSSLPSSFRRALLFLASNVPARGFSKNKPKSSSSPGGSSLKHSEISEVGYRLGPFGFPIPELELLSPGIGMSTLVADALGSLGPGEAPRQLKVLIVDPDSVDQEVLQVDLGSSRRWLQAALNRTLLSQGVMSEMELIRVQRYLAALNTTEDIRELEARLLVGLSFALGRDVNSVLSLACGIKGVIDDKGSVTIGIVRPENSFRPEGAGGTFRGLLSRVILRLPDSLGPLVSQYASVIKPVPFYKCLETSVDELRAILAEDMEFLRENGKYDISLVNISTALRDEIQLRTESSLLAFHIGRREGEVMPSLGWYQSFDDAQIREAYREASRFLFNE